MLAQKNWELRKDFKYKRQNISVATKLTHRGNLKFMYSELMCLFTAIKQAGNFRANAFSNSSIA